MPPSRLPPPPDCPLRLAVVPFLNMLPLVGGLRRLAPHWQLDVAPPSQLLERLDRGACDLAMLPALDFLRHRDRYGLLDGSCIASRGAVASVLILSRPPIAAATSIQLDAASRTSNALARLLLDGPLGRPDLPDTTDDDASPATCVRIGDRALVERERYAHVIDMGEEWQRWQSLPFVYAVWATRGQAPWDEIARFLCAVRDDNLTHLDRCLRDEPDAVPDSIDDAIAAQYLRDQICYDFGSEERQGLERFAALLGEAGQATTS